MLTHLTIKNFAIIHTMEIDFHANMTCLTGETGAGKSIIIDSLELVLGGRADTSLISPDAEKCEIIAIFDLGNIPLAQEWLLKHEYHGDSNGHECIIRRTVAKDGRSRSTINGYSVTQQQLKVIGNLLVSIHGQHENQSLLNSSYQLELLDAFATNQIMARDVKNSYDILHGKRRELIKLEEMTKDSEAKLELVRYQLNEFQAIDDILDQLDSLRVKQKKFSSLEQSRINISAILDAISENEHGTAIGILYEAKNNLENCKYIADSMNTYGELLQNIIVQLEELASSLRSTLRNLDHDSDDPREIEEKLDLIYTIARKHRVEPSELAQVKITLEQQLASLESLEIQRKTIENSISECEATYMAVANSLSKRRKIAANKLNLLICEKIQQLAMVEGKFSADLSSNHQIFSPQGLEQVEFLVSTNPGHPMQPLSKIASGGELSRISLAIQTITAEKQITPTLVFDEVDSGIGGKTADIIGQLLRELSTNTQIICITHLPQIAAKAQHHMAIEKMITKEQTQIKLMPLNERERIGEIARMLGGLKVTQHTLAHAKEMLENI